MVTTLAGENSFALQRKLDELTGVFVAEHGDLALERLNGEEAEIERLQEALTSLPFLASHKLVVLRSPSKNKAFIGQAEQLLIEIPETTDVILVEPKLDKRLGYYKFLKSKTDFKKFPELDQNGLVHWLTEAAKQQGGSLSPADARYLVERAGANQQLLSKELEKLLIFSSTVTRQTIDLLTDPTPQSTIFQLLETAFAGRTKRTLELYSEQRALKVEPQQIIALLAWQLHILAIIKAAGDHSAEQIAQKGKLNPYVIRKSQGIARDLSAPELKKLINRLLNIDVAIKRSNIDADEALQHYFLSLAR